MKIKYLFKFSILMVIIVLLLFLILSLISYFFNAGKVIGYIYNVIAPLCIFIAAFLYAMRCGERGLLRGLEIWAVYFLVIVLLKFIAFNGIEINLIKHILYIPVGIIAGIIGVNFHK